MASLPPSRSIPNGSPNRDALWLPAASQFSPAMKLPPFFEENRLIVDAALERLLPAATAQPSSVHTAMRYSVFADGKRIHREMLEYCHRSKTAALIRASITAGALCAGASSEDVARLQRFGETIGWAFQVTDDILDVEESSAALGKTAGKDMAQQKATYPAVYGLGCSHQIANAIATKGTSELAPSRERAARLRVIAEFLVPRMGASRIVCSSTARSVSMPST